jgi:hypothetical protein
MTVGWHTQSRNPSSMEVTPVLSAPMIGDMWRNLLEYLPGGGSVGSLQCAGQNPGMDDAHG